MQILLSFLKKLWGALPLAPNAKDNGIAVGVTIPIMATGFQKGPISMEWNLKRTLLDPKVTLGELSDENGKFLCYTMEDAARIKKIQNETCIPAGRYQVDYTWSGRFNRMLPLLLNVPLYTSIRIHSGNTPADTDGCILVGTEKYQDSGAWYLRNSMVARNMICDKVVALKFPLYLTISGGYTSAEMTL